MTSNIVSYRNMEIMKEQFNAWCYNTLYAKYYNTIDKYSVKARDAGQKIQNFWMFLVDVKDAIIEVKRMREYEQLRVDYYHSRQSSVIIMSD